MAFGRPAPIQHLARALLNDIPGCQEDDRIEIALQRLPRLDPADRLVQGHPPVHSYDVGTRLAHCPEQLAGADAEVNPGHAGVGQRGEDPPAVRQHARAIVVQAERSGPGVEQLHGAGSGGDLRPQEPDGDLGQPAHQVRPQFRSAVEELLGQLEVFRRPALHEITGQGERAPGEADEGLAAQVSDQGSNGLGHVRDVVGHQRPELRDVGGGPDRMVHHRADARPNVDPNSDRAQRDDDVAEEDRRVHVVPADRLQGDFGDEVGIGEGVQHLLVGPQRPVLGQRPARHAHVPDRCIRHLLPPTGKKERGFFRSRCHSRMIPHQRIWPARRGGTAGRVAPGAQSGDRAPAAVLALGSYGLT